jgi:hypothetical protein
MSNAKNAAIGCSVATFIPPLPEPIRRIARGVDRRLGPSTSYTNGVKLKLLREHGLPAEQASLYELDHFIPLALGGSPRSPDNLWLQSWDGR